MIHWRSNKKSEWLISIITLYVVLSIIIYFATPFLIFKPPTPSKQLDPHGFFIKNATHTIAAMYFHQPKNRYTVLFSHGNANDLRMIKPMLESFYQHGYNILAYDYSGYGHSPGDTSERNCEADALLAYDYLTKQQHIPSDRIILMGHSMGTGVTTYLATKVKSAAVILQSPMLSIYRIITHFPIFFPDYFTSYRDIKKIHEPILILHGTQDQVIPFYHGKQLYQMANPPKTFKAVEGAGHNNIAMVMGNKYFQTLQQFTQTLNATPSPA